jgi:hypothetical protein
MSNIAEARGLQPGGHACCVLLHDGSAADAFYSERERR